MSTGTPYEHERDRGIRSWHFGPEYMPLTGEALCMSASASGIFRARTSTGITHYSCYLFSPDVARLLYNLGWLID